MGGGGGVTFFFFFLAKKRGTGGLVDFRSTAFVSAQGPLQSWEDVLVHFLHLTPGEIKAQGSDTCPLVLQRSGIAEARRAGARRSRPIRIPGKTPRRRYRLGRPDSDPQRPHPSPPGALCFPAPAGRWQHRPTPDSHGAGLRGAGTCGRVPQSSRPRGAGWWAGWKAASGDHRRRARARCPNTKETCGPGAGGGEMEPGPLGRGRSGAGGWGAAPGPGRQGGLPERLSKQLVRRLLPRP